MLSVVFWLPALSLVAALLVAGVLIQRGPRPIRREAVVETLLRCILVFAVGLAGVWAFVGHVFFTDQVAAFIGWPPSPRFQFELGMVNLAGAMVGLIAAFWRDFGFRLSATLMAVGFLWGADVGHLIDLARTGNTAPGNAGALLYTNFLTPLALLILLFLGRKGRAAG